MHYFFYFLLPSAYEYSTDTGTVPIKSTGFCESFGWRVYLLNEAFTTGKYATHLKGKVAQIWRLLPGTLYEAFYHILQLDPCWLK